MGFVLSIVANILYLVVAIVDFFVVMYKNAKVEGFFRVMNKYWFERAIQTDINGNEAFADTWNVLFRKRGGYRFGAKGETISSALGKNQRDGTLSWFGWIINIALWIIDVKYWRKGGHSLNSIQDI